MTVDYKEVSTFINRNLQKMIKMSTFANRKWKKYSICLLLENNNIKDHF